MENQTYSQKDAIVKEHKDILKKWNGMKNFWRFLYYLLGILVIICSLTVSFSLFTVPLNKISAPITAFCALLMNFLLPNKKAISYVKAIALLSKHLSNYEHGEKYAAKFVFQAKIEGEQIIANQDLVGELTGIKNE
jgi:hypothetical protein